MFQWPETGHMAKKPGDKGDSLYWQSGRQQCWGHEWVAPVQKLDRFPPGVSLQPSDPAWGARSPHTAVPQLQPRPLLTMAPHSSASHPPPSPTRVPLESVPQKARPRQQQDRNVLPGGRGRGGNPEGRDRSSFRGAGGRLATLNRFCPHMNG